MCHHYDARGWEDRTTVDEETEEPESEPETPEFLAEEAAEDVDLLTDGGDDDE
jgi:hypothetical protein